MSALRLSVLIVLALALGVPGIAAGKRKPPPPPPPPPDSAADRAFVVEPSIDDYIVLATLLVGVRCETTKQRIDATITEFTRDGVSVPMLPVGADRRTCLNASACFLGIDLFSYDNHPVAFPGDQLYCANGSGVVGGRVVGPGSGCEHDARI
jgi:hypothetical protein